MDEVIRSLRRGSLILALILGGCAGLRNGPPAIVTTQDLVSTTAGVRNTLRDTIISDCLNVQTMPNITESRESRRDRLVSAYVFAVDVAYNEYERNLLDSIRENDLGATVASLALSGIGSGVGIPNLAQALDITNSIVTGTHTAIGRDYLLNQTLSTLQTQMRATRNRQRAIILRRLGLAISQWNSCTALSDVLVFEQAGTLNAAIAAIAASAAQADRAADLDVQRAIPTEYATGPLADALHAYLNNDANHARRDTALAAMDDLGLGVRGDLNRLQEIVEDDPSAPERRLLVRRIIRIERDRDAAAANTLQAAFDREVAGAN